MKKIYIIITFQERRNTMYYILPKTLKKQIIEQDDPNLYLYYDEKQGVFFDKNHNPIDLERKKVIPFADIFRIDYLLDQIEDCGGIPINGFEEMEKVKHWFQYIDSKRDIIPIIGKDFTDLSFLTMLFETYGINGSVFVKTVEKDYHGIIPVTEIIDPNSSFRKAIDNHLYDEFLIEPVISIDEDELGKQEYRAFIYNRKPNSISRPLRYTYHRIPEEVIIFIEQVLQELPKEFPNAFVLDIVKTNGNFDILEMNPIETSAPYLYNSRRMIDHPDLTHQNVTELPPSKKGIPCTYFPGEITASPLFEEIPESFAKDYHDIKTYGHIKSLAETLGLSLSSLFHTQEDTSNPAQKKKQ